MDRIENQDCSKLIRIPGGDFLMGTDEADAQRMADQYGWRVTRFRDESPPHTVHLDPYYISQFPVTVAQYDRYLQETGAVPPQCWDDPRFKESSQPVVGVAHYDAEAYASWAGLRLPTEAEWEKAARGNDGRRWPWGNEWDPQRANTRETGVGHPTPVDHYTDAGNVSPYGVCDMVGNVWEWCQDRYADDFYTFSPQSNPICTKPIVHYDAHNVLRGGSWYSIAERARCAARYDRFPQMHRRHIGFRCARDA